MLKKLVPFMDTATLACLTRTCSMDTAAIDTRLKNLTTEVAITSRSTAEIQYVNQRGELKHVHINTNTTTTNLSLIHI